MQACTIVLTSVQIVKTSDDGRFCDPHCPKLRFKRPGIGYNECDLIDLNNTRMNSPVRGAYYQIPIWDLKAKRYRRTKRCRKWVSSVVVVRGGRR